VPELAGEVVWVGLYVSLGAVFGHALTMVSDALSTLIGLATSLTLMLFTIKLLRRRVARGRKSITFGESS
jgi:membrane protein DedA with SNARE-associated domain